jgi:hypothetical protein
MQAQHREARGGVGGEGCVPVPAPSHHDSVGLPEVLCCCCQHPKTLRRAAGWLQACVQHNLKTSTAGGWGPEGGKVGGQQDFALMSL